MENGTEAGGLRLLIPSRFTAYQLGTVPWGLPYQFAKFPQAIVIFDEILCDRHGLDAEISAYKTMGWTSGWIYSQLYQPSGENIVKGVYFRSKHRDLFPRVSESTYRSQIARQRASRNQSITYFDMLDNVTTVCLAQRENAIPFGWTSDTLQVDPVDVLKKSAILFTRVFNYVPLMPPFESLSHEAKRQLKDARNVEEPLWRRLEECQIDWREYQEQRASVMKRSHRIIDEELIEPTEKRLKRVLEMRRAFKEVRQYLQREMNALKSNSITPEQFQEDLKSVIPKEIDEFETELREGEEGFKVRVFFTAMTAFLMSVLSGGNESRELGKIAVGGLAEATRHWYERVYKTRQRHPLGYLNHRFRSKIQP